VVSCETTWLQVVSHEATPTRQQLGAWAGRWVGAGRRAALLLLLLAAAEGRHTYSTQGRHAHTTRAAAARPCWALPSLWRSTRPQWVASYVCVGRCVVLPPPRRALLPWRWTLHVLVLVRWTLHVLGRCTCVDAARAWALHVRWRCTCLGAARALTLHVLGRCTCVDAALALRWTLHGRCMDFVCMDAACMIVVGRCIGRCIGHRVPAPRCCPRVLPLHQAQTALQAFRQAEGRLQTGGQAPGKHDWARSERREVCRAASPAHTLTSCLPATLLSSAVAIHLHHASPAGVVLGT
jgi:hypothetical protein